MVIKNLYIFYPGLSGQAENRLLLHLDRLFGVLVSSLSRGSAGGARLEHGLSVLVELQLGDDTVGWVDANVDGGAVDLLSLGSLDVDDELLSVNGLDSASRLSLVVTSDNHDLMRINKRTQS